MSQLRGAPVDVESPYLLAQYIGKPMIVTVRELTGEVVKFDGVLVDFRTPSVGYGAALEAIYVTNSGKLTGVSVRKIEHIEILA